MLYIGFEKYYKGLYCKSNGLGWFARFRTQFLQDHYNDPFLSSVSKVCVNKLCVSKLCVNKLSVIKLCVDKLCVDKLGVREAAGGGGRREGTTKNKNPTQRCGEKPSSCRLHELSLVVFVVNVALAFALAGNRN